MSFHLSLAVSEFSSMMKEMEVESHSKKEGENPMSQHPITRQSDRKQKTEVELGKSKTSPKMGQRKGKEDDTFSAAMNALSKLNIDSELPGATDRGGRKSADGGKGQRANESPPRLAAGTKKLAAENGGGKDLAPSVAAVFNAVASGKTIPASSGKDRSATAPDTIQTATLKSMLQIKDDTGKREKEALPSSPRARMPEALQKLMTPPTLSASPPRGPLLPHPYYQPPIPLRGNYRKWSSLIR